MMRKSLSSELIYRYGQMRRLASGILRKPLGYYFYITGKCNLNCTYCWQREQAKQNHHWHDAMKKELTPEEWKQVTEKLPRCGFLGLSGGEVTVSKAFPLIMETAAKKNIAVTINTNARFLTDTHLDLLTMKNVKNISVSLDGFADVHDHSRSMPGLFDEIVANLKRLNERRKKNHSLSLTIKTVLLDENIEQLIRFREFCEKELLANTLNISFMKTGNHAQFSFLYGDEIGKILSERKTSLHTYRHSEKILKVLENLLQENAQSKCEVELFPRMSKITQIRDFIEHQGKNIYAPCYLPWAMTVVLPDGAVIPCLSFCIGNVRDDQYDTNRVLRRKKYLDFLKKIKSCGHAMPEACHVCCFLKVRSC